MFQAFAPHVLPLTVEEGIANGVAEVRKAVRYQIKYGAQLIKVCASGGVMSHTGPAGAQQYSDEELRAIADEAHRAGLKVAAHAHGDDGIRAAIEAGIDCIEHGSLMSDETLDLMIERGTFLVPTTYLADGMDVVARRRPSCRPRRPRCSPGPRPPISKAIERGARIACGTDAPAIPHGRNAKELIALVDRGMTPLQAIRAATTVAAELIDVDDRGRLEPGLLADVIAVRGDPPADITRDRAGRVRDEGRQGVPPRRRRHHGPVALARSGRRSARTVQRPSAGRGVRGPPVRSSSAPMPWMKRSHSCSASSWPSGPIGVPLIVAAKALNMIAWRTTPATAPVRQARADGAGGGGVVEQLLEQRHDRHERPGGLLRVLGQQLLARTRPWPRASGRSSWPPGPRGVGRHSR